MGISEKLVYLKETKEQIKSALKTPYNVYRDYATLIEKYVKNQPKSIVEGEQAICENAIDLPCNVDINGNSKQETAEGYNLLQVDETNWELTDNGIKSLGKPAMNTGVNLLAVDMNLKANITYYLNFVLLVRPTSSTSFTSYIDKVENNNISFMSIEKEANFTIGKLMTKTYTPTKDETFKVIMWGNANKGIFEFQYWITTDSRKKTYEPYTGGQAFPNPNHKEDIEVIAECSLVHRGANRFNPNNVTNEFLLNNGTATANTSAICTDYIEVEGDTLTVGSNINWYDIAIFYDENKIFISRELMSAGNVEDEIEFRTFKRAIPSNAKYVRYCCSIKTTKPMLAFGSYDAYEPYIEPKTIEIDLVGHSLAKVGEIADLLNIGVDGSCKINKNIFIEKITSSNVIGKSTYGTNAYNIKPSRTCKPANNNGTKVLSLSNYFKGIAYNDRTNGIKDSIYTETNINIIIRDTLFTTVEELKTFLDNNEVYIMYVLNTSDTINLPSIEPIKLIEGITHVFELVTNLRTTMKVEYIVDANTLQDEITELSNAVIELGGTL